MLKRRTKVLVGVGVGAVVLLSAGALLVRPQAQYDFLAGAELHRIEAVEYRIPPTYTHTFHRVSRRYRLPHRFREVYAIASEELLASGWQKGTNDIEDSPVRRFSNVTGEYVTIAALPTYQTEVIVSKEVDWSDRAQMWLWDLTHRSRRTSR